MVESTRKTADTTPATKQVAQANAAPEHAMPEIATLPGLLHGGGSELRRRTVTQMQRTFGNRATQRILGQAARPAQVTQRAPESVQRDFGFEMETNWRIFDYVAAQNGGQATLTNNQKTTPFNPGKNYQPAYVTDDLKKGQDILQGNHFELQVDELPSGGKDIEFVSSLPAFPETATGRTNLDNTLTALDALVQAMLNGTHNQHPADLATHGTVVHDAVIRKNTNGGMNGSPQITAAIRLDQIEELFETMGTKTGETPDNSKDTTRQKLSGLPSTSPQRTTEAGIMGDAPSQARAAIGRYQNTLATHKKVGHQSFGQGVGSGKMVGLMSLIITYMKIGASGQPDYAKQIAPLLARTNFAAMFEGLDPAEVTHFKKNPKEWVDVCLDGAGFVGGGSSPILTQGISSNPKHDILKKITREKWLRLMTKGVDILSQAGFDKEFGKNKGGKELESLGRLGSKKEFVGGSKMTAAPIFEMRRMKGSVPYTDWHQLILDAFDYVKAVNDKQNNPRM